MSRAPISRTKLASRPKPTARTRLASRLEPAARTGPVVHLGLAARPKPTARTRLAARLEPASRPGPAARIRPAARLEPAARIRPAARARLAAVLLAALVAVLLAGCGLGAGTPPKAISLTVTRDFGARVVRSWGAPAVAGQETVMRLLMRNATVTTQYGGGFVQSIDGLASGTSGGEPLGWFYYVNGVEASQGAASTYVDPGDHIWWDLHDWSQTDNVPAVVGSFPEPFLNGVGGKRWPVRLECAVLSSEPCTIVAARLRALGVLAPLAAIGPGEEPEALRLLVGPWTEVGRVTAVHGIEDGPRSSGVYARFSPDGSTLTVLDQQGSAARTLSAGAGLVAATRSGEEAPVWVITGTDEAGVTRAAHAFDAASLHDRFALALAPGGEAVPVPASASRPTTAASSVSRG